MGDTDPDWAGYKHKVSCMMKDTTPATPGLCGNSRSFRGRSFW